MNEMDQLARLRNAVPLEVTPRAELLFQAALREELYPERLAVPRRRNPLSRIWSPWRLGVVASAAAALAAGIVVAAQPSGPTARPSSPTVLTVKLLADRASAAALTQPAVSPAQWVYRVVEWHHPDPRKGAPAIGTEAGWETADGTVTYGRNYSAGTGESIPAYSQLGSLPRDPAALDAYLAHLVYPDSKPAPDIAGMSAFSSIKDMLTNYVLPPALEAEMYQALAAIPGIEADSHVTAIDGRAGVAFVLPPTPQSEKLEIILNASDYSLLAKASWDAGNSTPFETAIVRMVLVGAPGSTRPSLMRPTAAQSLAEQADRAATFTTTPGLFVKPGTWVLRDLATSAGDQTVWATADDSEQASYANGKLTVCSRSAACAKSTQWLMPAGPGYPLASPALGGREPASERLPDYPPQLIAALNRYRTGCTDVEGDCNAVNVLASMMAGYAVMGGTRGDWFLMLAEVPGVTVQRVTDVTSRADLAFRYPFTDGVTEILLNAATRQFAGFVRDGAETVITKEATVSGPGSDTPAVNPPSPARLPQASR